MDPNQSTATAPAPSAPVETATAPAAAPAPNQAAAPVQTEAPAAPVQANADGNPAAPVQAAPAEPTAPVQSNPVASPEVQAAEPTVLETALSVGQSRAKLMAQNRTMAGQVGTLQAEVARLQGENQSLANQVQNLTGERDQVAAALNQANQEAATVSEGVVQTMASLNVPREELPAPSASGESQKGSAAIYAKFQQTNDPDEKAALYQEFKEAQKAEAAGGDFQGSVN